MTKLTNYPPAVAELLAPDLVPPLGPGTPNTAAYGKLKALRIETAFAPHAIMDRDMAACCLAGLWLFHGYLDKSHKVSQEIETVSGSYWHGLMHRCELDFGNAKYWFRRVGKHPVFADLHREAARLAAATGVDDLMSLTTQREWDPFAFVDLCERSLDQQSVGEALCKRIQRCEWDLLFGHCYRLAIADSGTD